MKKRIISLILVVVMSALALVGCGYSYENDDVTQYVSFDKAAFAKALKEIVVDQGDFGSIESVRIRKVEDAVYADYAKYLADETTTEGAPEKHDTFNYCYYVTASVNVGSKDKPEYVDKIVLYSNMTESKATSLHVDNSDLEGLDKKISELVLEKGAIDEYVYSTTADGKVEGGMTVYVSYTELVPVYNNDGEIEQNTDKTDKTTTTIYNYVKVEIPAASEADAAEAEVYSSLGEALVGKDIGSKLTETFKVEKTDVTNAPDGAAVATCKDVTVHWQVNSEKEYGTVDVTYDESGITSSNKSQAPQIQTSTSDKVDLSGAKNLKYHIFPVNYVSVPEIDAYYVIKSFGKNFTADSLECVAEAIEGKDDLNKIITNADTKDGIVELLAALATAEEATTTAEEAYEKSDTEANKNKVTEAQKAEDEAEKKVDEAIKKLLDKVSGLDAKIVKELSDDKYDSLESSYNATVKKNVAKEVYAAARKYIKFNKKDSDGLTLLPRAAVNEAYATIENTLKAEFYEGTTTDSDSNTVSYYSQYEGNYDKFLRDQLKLDADAPNQEVYDAIGAQAEDAVKEVIIVYVLANYCGDEVDVTDEEFKEFKRGNIGYMLAAYSGEEIDENQFLAALQLNKVMDYFLETEEVDDKAEDKRPVYVHGIEYKFTDDVEDK